MKKDRKKLGLSRETLHHLTGRELRRAHGGLGETTVRCVEASECQCVSQDTVCVTTTDTCGGGSAMTTALCTGGSYC